METIIWKYHDKDYISYYARFQNNKGQQGVKLLTDDDFKVLGIQLPPKE